MSRDPPHQYHKTHRWEWVWWQQGDQARGWGTKWIALWICEMGVFGGIGWTEEQEEDSQGFIDFQEGVSWKNRDVKPVVCNVLGRKLILSLFQTFQKGLIRSKNKFTNDILQSRIVPISSSLQLFWQLGQPDVLLLLTMSPNTDIMSHSQFVLNWRLPTEKSADACWSG